MPGCLSVIARSETTKQSPGYGDCFASLAMTSTGVIRTARLEKRPDLGRFTPLLAGSLPVTFSANSAVKDPGF